MTAHAHTHVGCTRNTSWQQTAVIHEANLTGNTLPVSHKLPTQCKQFLLLLLVAFQSVYVRIISGQRGDPESLRKTLHLPCQLSVRVRGELEKGCVAEKS